MTMECGFVCQVPLRPIHTKTKDMFAGACAQDGASALGLFENDTTELFDKYLLPGDNMPGCG